jgi:hypothetical protein
MKLNLAVSLSALLVILFIGTVGVFLIYVPALTVFTVASVLVGLGLMFALGLATGSRWRKSSRFTHRAMRDDLSVVR